jgi:hypothetical protein
LERREITAASPVRPEVKPPERRAKMNKADVMMLRMEWRRKSSLAACRWSLVVIRNNVGEFVANLG